MQKRNQEEDEKREEPPKVTNSTKEHSVRKSEECLKTSNEAEEKIVRPVEVTSNSPESLIDDAPESLDVVPPEGSSFEFLTQPASMEESYVEIIEEKKDSRLPQIPDQPINSSETQKSHDNVAKEDECVGKDESDVSSDDFKKKQVNESVKVIDQTFKDESVILNDSPIDDSVVILENETNDDSVIICEEEINSVRHPVPAAASPRSPIRTRGFLNKEHEDKEEMVLLRTEAASQNDAKLLEESDFSDSDDDESDDDSDESVESVETQITNDLEKSDTENMSKDAESANNGDVEEHSKDKLNDSLKIDLRPSWQVKKTMAMSAKSNESSATV